MTDWTIVSHKAAIAGQVTDSQTNRAIGGAVVRIIDAPQSFVEIQITKAKLIGLQDEVTLRLNSLLEDPGTSNSEKLQVAQLLLDYDWLFIKAKLMAYRGKAISSLIEVLDDPGKSLPEKLQDSRIILDKLQPRISATSTNDRPDRSVTATDGHFHFLDLPDEAYEYTLGACLPGGGTRYGTVLRKVTVSLSIEGSITMATTDIMLPPTTLKGKITAQDSDGPAPVVLAEAKIMGSGESAFSNNAGDYLLDGLETGKRRIEVTARGYQPVTQQVIFSQPGEERILDLVMAKKKKKKEKKLTNTKPISS